MTAPRIYLSPPHLGLRERELVTEAFDTNWISSVGPNVDAFEREFADKVGVEHAVALCSGTAALHLSLILAEVGTGDEVLVSDLTFVASINPAVYQGAKPVFIDSETESWNLDPALLEQALKERADRGKLPKALILVHLYGQAADTDPILASCAKYGVPVIEDAAEALGATYNGRQPGIDGLFGIYSFNGNKIITTSGGGMLVTGNAEHAKLAKKLSTQARDQAPHYQHSMIGYNYRLSNVLAGIGRGQLEVLDDRVAARRRIFDRYVELLGDLPGVEFQPEAKWGTHTRWLTCLTIDPSVAGVDRDTIRLALEAQNIEARPTWKPMHMQPIFEDCQVYGGAVSRRLFEQGLCLPSGSALTDDELGRVVETFRAAF